MVSSDVARVIAGMEFIIVSRRREVIEYDSIHNGPIAGEIRKRDESALLLADEIRKWLTSSQINGEK